MPDLPDPVHPAWDAFHAFLEPVEVPDGGPAADAALRKLGIDASAAQARVLNAVRQARAKAELAAAKERAAAVGAHIAAVPSSVDRLTRERVRQLIAERCDEATQRAYFRKLDESSSDDDLRAILDDLDCLKDIAGGQSDGDRPG